MAINSEAYDFSLFEARYDNTAPAREPRREQREQTAPQIVELPRERVKPAAKPKLHPVRAMAAVVSFVVFTALCVAMVYSQQQLAVLTEEINAAAQALEESQSLEVQLNMAAARKMNSAQVEEYAVKELGMSKVNLGQMTYVSVAREDQGTVIQNVDGGSVLDQLWASVRAWLA